MVVVDGNDPPCTVAEVGRVQRVVVVGTVVHGGGQ